MNLDSFKGDVATIHQIHRFYNICREKDPSAIASEFPPISVLTAGLFQYKRTIVHELVLSGESWAVYSFLTIAKTMEKDEPFLTKLINQQDDYGFTPVAIACSSGFEETARMLIALGADLFLRDTKHKFHAIHWLITATNNMSLLQGLVKEGSYIETEKDRVNGVTLVELAISCKKVTLARYLLKSKCVIGDNAVIYAINVKSDKLFHDLLTGCQSVDFQDADGMTALHHAAVFGDEWGRVVTLKLLAAGANANILTNDHGWTPLMCAVLSKKPNLELIQALIDAKCNLLAQEKKNGTTALIMSLTAPDEVFRLLTRFKSTELLKLKDTFGNDVLRLASLMNHPLSSLLK
jgi:ankyrin repeat protein